jgi:hypothetical protein
MTPSLRAINSDTDLASSIQIPDISGLHKEHAARASGGATVRQFRC